MNSLERVLAALQNQPADRPAFLLYAGLYGAKLTGVPLAEHYRDPARFAEGQMAIRETFSPDLLLSPFMLAGVGAAFGSHISEPRRQPPNVMAFAAASAQAALALPLPDVDSHPQLLYLRESVRILARTYAGEVPIIGLLASPLDLPPVIIGLEAWLDALLFQPDTARALLDRLTPFFVALGKALFADGATALALTANFGNPFILPAALTRDLTRPCLEQALEALPGPVILHQGGCPLLAHLDGFRGLPNTVGYVVAAGENLAEARGILGAGPLLLGNLDGPGLADLTPEAVSTRCDQVLAQAAPDRQFILATSEADIPLDTPPECLQAITDAICRGGRGSGMMGTGSSVRCIACSIFKREIEALQASGRLELPVDYLNSMLHMVPARLETRLQAALATVRGETPEAAVVLAYGDCCGRMEELEREPGTHRTEGINCCEIILGHQAYRKLRREGAFFLMPEWALAWKQVFVGQLGLLGPCAKEFMREMHTRLVYLDTGILPVPQAVLAEASAFLGLPVEVLPVSLDPLLASLQQATHATRSHGAD